MQQSLQRISLMLRRDQHEAINRLGLNLSGLVRDLVDDYLSESKITINVTDETKLIYDRIVANTGATDQDVEPFLKQALQHLLAAKINRMQTLHADLSSTL